MDWTLTNHQQNAAEFAFQPGDSAGNISFLARNEEILRLEANGDIYVNGRLTETDKQVVDALRVFLRNSGCLTP